MHPLSQLQIWSYSSNTKTPIYDVSHPTAQFSDKVDWMPYISKTDLEATRELFPVVHGKGIVLSEKVWQNAHNVGLIPNLDTHLLILDIDYKDRFEFNPDGTENLGFTRGYGIFDKLGAAGHYVEHSPSGKGFRLIACIRTDQLAQLERKHFRKPYECYTTGGHYNQFIQITEDYISGSLQFIDDGLFSHIVEDSQRPKKTITDLVTVSDEDMPQHERLGGKPINSSEELDALLLQCYGDDISFNNALACVHDENNKSDHVYTLVFKAMYKTFDEEILQDWILDKFDHSDYIRKKLNRPDWWTDQVYNPSLDSHSASDDDTLQVVKCPIQLPPLPEETTLEPTKLVLPNLTFDPLHPFDEYQVNALPAGNEFFNAVQEYIMLVSRNNDAQLSYIMSEVFIQHLLSPNTFVGDVGTMQISNPILLIAESGSGKGRAINALSELITQCVKEYESNADSKAKMFDKTQFGSKQGLHNYLNANPWATVFLTEHAQTVLDPKTSQEQDIRQCLLDLEDANKKDGVLSGLAMADTGKYKPKHCLSMNYIMDVQPAILAGLDLRTASTSGLLARIVCYDIPTSKTHERMEYSDHIDNHHEYYEWRKGKLVETIKGTVSEYIDNGYGFRAKRANSAGENALTWLIDVGVATTEENAKAYMDNARDMSIPVNTLSPEVKARRKSILKTLATLTDAMADTPLRSYLMRSTVRLDQFAAVHGFPDKPSISSYDAAFSKVMYHYHIHYKVSGMTVERVSIDGKNYDPRFCRDIRGVKYMSGSDVELDRKYAIWDRFLNMQHNLMLETGTYSGVNALEFKQSFEESKLFRRSGSGDGRHFVSRFKSALESLTDNDELQLVKLTTSGQLVKAKNITKHTYIMAGDYKPP